MHTFVFMARLNQSMGQPMPVVKGLGCRGLGFKDPILELRLLNPDPSFVFESGSPRILEQEMLDLKIHEASRVWGF